MIKQKNLEKIASASGLVLIIVSVVFLTHEFGNIDFGKVERFINDIPLSHFIMAGGLVIAAFLAMFGYDTLALQYAKAKLPAKKIALASFTGGAFGNSIGLPVVGVGGLRLRFYTVWGLTSGQLTRIIFFVGIGSWAGLLTITGVTLLFWPPTAFVSSTVSTEVVRAFGAAFLAFVFVYVALCFHKGSIRLWRWDVPLPSGREVLLQTFFGIGDWAAQALLVYVLLPTGVPVPLTRFLGAFFPSMMASMIGHVPAGLGVFDSGMFLLLGQAVQPETLVGVLIMYRVIFHLIPLLLAVVLFSVFEVRVRLPKGH